MKGILKIGLGILTAYSAFSFAGGETGYQPITLAQQRGCSVSKGFEITLSTAHENPDGCDDHYRLEISCDLPGFDQMVSIALTALAADKQINAWVSGCDSQGQANVLALTIKK